MLFGSYFKGHINKKALATLLAVFSLVVVSGCGGSKELAPTISLTPKSIAIAAGGAAHFIATSSDGSVVRWFVNGVQNGSSTLGTIDVHGNYVAPVQTSGTTVSVIARSDSAHSAEDFATVYVVPPGQVVATRHPQVARYTVNAPASAKSFIQFGIDTNYGLQTWTQSSPQSGGGIEFLVAGMHAFTQYHMRAVVEFRDGTRFLDQDHVFTTGGLQGTDVPIVSAQTMPGKTPQPGIELVNDVQSPGAPVFATDLAGNIIWYYKFTGGSAVDIINPIQPLANGHFLLTLSGQSDALVNVPNPPGTINVLREIDLAGTTIRELTPDDLNARLAAAGFSLSVATIHHEVLPLPNGHFIIVTNLVKQFANLAGFAGPVNVLGDALVDLDASWKPVWTWTTFDHLDVNRHPMQFPDWTHANGLVYLDDGNLLLSMRHQHWVIKIDYRDGAGGGDILWRLGGEGDFALQGGTDPTDWFYGQHGPKLVKTEAPGVFSLSLMDNGNNRMFALGQSCATLGLVQCPYSSGVVYRIDERGKTATITTHMIPPYFSAFGGYTNPLPNGNMEFDFCAATGLPQLAVVYEVTTGINPEVVWQMNVGGFAYRAFRLPSLYPGVQW
jgi:hypothetical protein